MLLEETVAKLNSEPRSTTPFQTGASQVMQQLLQPELPQAPTQSQVQSITQNTFAQPSQQLGPIVPRQTAADLIKPVATSVLPPPTDPIKEEVKEEAPVVEEPKVEPAVAAELPAIEAVKDLTASYKELKGTYKETKSKLAALEEEKTKLADRVKAYETGEVVPEAVTKLQTRIAELEPLEALLDLKKSEPYQEKVASLKTVQNKITSLGKAYNIPDEVMLQAAEITNEPELNAFLLDHFDTLAALKVDGAIKEYQNSKQEIKSLEAKPKEAFSELSAEHERINAAKEMQRTQNIIENGKSAWTSAVMSIREQGKIQELIPRPNDPTFNSTWVEPLQNRASEQYGRLVTALGTANLKTLDPEVGKDLATTVLLATVASTAIERANAAEARLEEIERNTRRTHTLLRPTPGAVGGGAAGGPAPAKINSPTDAAKKLGESVGMRF